MSDTKFQASKPSGSEYIRLKNKHKNVLILSKEYLDISAVRLSNPLLLLLF